MKLAYRIIALIAVGGLIVLATGAYALGVMSYERYSGYFAPVWDDAGKAIYFIQRDTSGFIWGMGWAHFSPPASSYITSDVFSLRRLTVESGLVEVLQSWADSPLVARTTKHYRGRIFNTVSARIEPAGNSASSCCGCRSRRCPVQTFGHLPVPGSRGCRQQQCGSRNGGTPVAQPTRRW